MKQPPQDNGTPTEEELPGMPTEPTRFPALPALRGSEKQIKWATTIRADALALDWPPPVVITLRSVDDASWWIANKGMVNTMKFKEPSPNQLAGSSKSNPLPAKGDQPPGAPLPPEVQSRFDDAVGWAASVSRHPLMAKAAILALLSTKYTGEMRSRLQAVTRETIGEIDFEIGRDMDAINRMLL